MRRPAGFTLLELLITLLVAATLLGLASPTFDDLRDEWALRAATRAVLGGLAQARLESLSMRSEARLCPTLDGSGCSEQGDGYLVRVGEGAAERTLLSADLPPMVMVRSNRPAATYYPWPRAALPVTLTLCAVRRHARSRLVIVSQSGRPRVERAGPCG